MWSGDHSVVSPMRFKQIISEFQPRYNFTLVFHNCYTCYTVVTLCLHCCHTVPTRVPLNASYCLVRIVVLCSCLSWLCGYRDKVRNLKRFLHHCNTSVTPLSHRCDAILTPFVLPRFSGYQQHDSSELLSFLLDGIHEDLNRVHAHMVFAWCYNGVTMVLQQCYSGVTVV
jgi:hypothetical protein